MFSAIRRLVRAHLSHQQQALAELQALRAEVGREREALTALQRAGIAAALGQQIAAVVAADGRHADPLSLPRHHAQLYSQNGEDGIIAEIFRRIGDGSRTFLEIGIEGGTQNNTRLLLEQGWRGVWIEGSAELARAAAERFAGPVAEGRLAVVHAIATPDTIETLLAGTDFPAQVDFLSLDIDQHTSHLWRALQRRARVACIEYNASVPPSLPIEVPFVPDGSWDGTNWFGGGLKALELIGAAKGMHLVGCDLHGVNAFFVDARETAGRFRAPFTAEAHFQPPQFWLVTHIGHTAAPSARHWIRAEEATTAPPTPA